jgi:uncharacterized membrane protein (Fun14 family)
MATAGTVGGGLITGYAIKKVIKLVAVIIGLLASVFVVGYMFFRLGGLG